MREGTDARPATAVGPDEPPRCAHNPCPGRSLVLGQRDDPGSGGFRAVDAGQLRERNAPGVFRCGPHRPVQAGVGACRAMRCDSSAAGPRWSSRKSRSRAVRAGATALISRRQAWRDHRRVRVRLFLRVPLSHGCLPANSRPGGEQGVDPAEHAGRRCPREPWADSLRQLPAAAAKGAYTRRSRLPPTSRSMAHESASRGTTPLRAHRRRRATGGGIRRDGEQCPVPGCGRPMAAESEGPRARPSSRALAGSRIR